MLNHNKQSKTPKERALTAIYYNVRKRYRGISSVRAKEIAERIYNAKQRLTI